MPKKFSLSKATPEPVAPVTPEAKEVLAAHGENDPEPEPDSAATPMPEEEEPATEEQVLERMVTEFKPSYIVTVVHNEITGEPLVIAWDTCGRCLCHVLTCACSNGPTQPSYIRKWQEQRVEPRLREYTAKHDEFAKVKEREAEEAAKRAASLSPSGRRKRKDSGVPRGPRKKAEANG